MRITGKAKKLAMAVVVPGVAIGTFAGFGLAPAMASTAQAAHHKEFKQELIAGATRSSSGWVPVSAYGAFRDRGAINLNGPSAGVTSIWFKHGKFTVYHNAGTSKSHLNKSTCVLVDKIVGQYWVLGGTGRYSHAEGWGTAHITFSAVLPKHRGHCDSDGKPLSTFTTFVAHGPVALDH